MGWTDIYGLMVSYNTKSFIKHVAANLNNRYSSLFSHYILLTEEMNSVVNPKKRPYIVMEAICDRTEYQKDTTSIPKQNPRVMLYAGGIEERYGLKMLVESFIMTEDLNAELHIYGSGSYVDELQEKCKLDSRIKYLGVKPNSEIVAAERKATILVNPRFTTEEFTKYSFPSKNMEYMVSGTPVLTTKLPGMPVEYNDFVYLIEEESLTGFSSAIRDVMNLHEDVLRDMGNRAKAFVLSNKNNKFLKKHII